MSDLRKSWILRAVLFVAILFAVLAATAGADLAISHLHVMLFGRPNDAMVEQVVFFILVCGRVWEWLRRRVWIGTARQ